MRCFSSIRKIFTCGLAAYVVMGGLALFSVDVCAQAIHTVTSNQDEGAGSLRQIIADASAGDEVQFDASLALQTITLTSGPLIIDKNLVITGPGGDSLSISGNGAFRVLDIMNEAVVTLAKLKIKDGFAEDVGGGIKVGQGASLTAHFLFIENNQAGDNGGGIYNDNFASTTLMHCYILNNEATGAGSPNGGGVYNASAGVMHIENTLISENESFRGGGIWNSSSGEMTLTGSAVSHNVAAHEAGGIYNNHRMIISGSSIFANEAVVDGGALRNRGVDTLVVVNSTISGNYAGNAGGIWNGDLGTVVLQNTTIFDNRVGFAGAGVWNDEGATLEIYSTILAGNKTDTDLSSDFINLGNSESAGFNFVGNGDLDGRVEGSKNFNGSATDQVGFRAAPLNPFLVELFDYGNGTPVHTPEPLSPVVDAGDCQLTGVVVDQKNDARLVDIPGDIYPNIGDGCDIGAVEISVSLATADEAPATWEHPENIQTLVYPNPFEGDASVEVRVAAERFVSITLHNLLGQQMKHIFAGRLLPNTKYVFTIDASDLAAGMYIYTTTTKTTTQSYPVVLVR